MTNENPLFDGPYPDVCMFPAMGADWINPSATPLSWDHPPGMYNAGRVWVDSTGCFRITRSPRNGYFISVMYDGWRDLGVDGDRNGLNLAQTCRLAATIAEWFNMGMSL